MSTIARPRRPLSPALPLLGVSILFAGCAAPSNPAASGPVGHPLTLATLFSQTSAEFEATALALYQSAGDRLETFLEDPNHSAALEQLPSGTQPAIILDVDETVLDNSPYEVRQILDGTGYPDGWAEWCDQAEAKPIPGALEFTKKAAAMGVTVFYVTNRKVAVKAGTRENLEKLGFPLRDDIDTVLTRGERDNWTSDKTSRRAHIAKDFRILMLFGDNTGDFVALSDAEGTPAGRRKAVTAHAPKWGREWVMLPNPMYGNWERAVLGNATNPTPKQINDLRLQAMDPMR